MTQFTASQYALQQMSVVNKDIKNIEDELNLMEERHIIEKLQLQSQQEIERANIMQQLASKQSMLETLQQRTGHNVLGVVRTFKDRAHDIEMMMAEAAAKVADENLRSE